MGPLPAMWILCARNLGRENGSRSEPDRRFQKSMLRLGIFTGRPFGRSFWRERIAHFRPAGASTRARKARGGPTAMAWAKRWKVSGRWVKGEQA